MKWILKGTFVTDFKNLNTAAYTKAAGACGGLVGVIGLLAKVIAVLGLDPATKGWAATIAVASAAVKPVCFNLGQVFALAGKMKVLYSMMKRVGLLGMWNKFKNVKLSISPAVSVNKLAHDFGLVGKVNTKK